MGVEKGNKVFILAESLSEAGQKVTIKWSQSFKDRSEEYYVTKYTNKSGSMSTSLLYPPLLHITRLTQAV